MGKKELKQQNKDFEINLVDIVSKFDPSETGKFTPFLIKVLREYWGNKNTKRLSRVRPNGYTRPQSDNALESLLINNLQEIFNIENLDMLISFSNHLENNRVSDNKKDISNYSTWGEIERENSLATIKYEQKRLEKEVIKVHEDDIWLAVKPLTLESSLTYGAGTKWCTSMKRNPDYFYRYSNNGVLIYLINKVDGDKYAVFYDIHNVRDEFTVWNASDKKIDSIESTIPIELMANIYKICKNDKPNFSYFSKEEREKLHWDERKEDRITEEPLRFINPRIEAEPQIGNMGEVVSEIEDNVDYGSDTTVSDFGEFMDNILSRNGIPPQDESMECDESEDESMEWDESEDESMNCEQEMIPPNRYETPMVGYMSSGGRPENNDGYLNVTEESGPSER